MQYDYIYYSIDGFREVFSLKIEFNLDHLLLQVKPLKTGFFKQDAVLLLKRLIFDLTCASFVIQQDEEKVVDFISARDS